MKLRLSSNPGFFSFCPLLRWGLFHSLGWTSTRCVVEDDLELWILLPPPSSVGHQIQDSIWLGKYTLPTELSPELCALLLWEL